MALIIASAIDSATELCYRPLVGPVLTGDIPTGGTWVIGGISFLYFVSFTTRGGANGGELVDTNVATWAAAMLLYFGSQFSLRLRFKAGCCRGAVAVVTAYLALVAFVSFILSAVSGYNGASAFLMFCSGLSCLGTLLVPLRSPPPFEPKNPDADPAGPAPTEKANSPPEDNLLVTLLLGFNGLCLTLSVLFLTLLMVGAGYAAQGASYSVRGKYLRAGPYRIAYNCEGPLNSGRPTLIMDCDASHGMMDFWPLQAEFTKAGRRSCIFDKPGIGWSDNFRADQDLNNFANFYDAMVAGLGEKPPYSLINWGGGALDFADRNPSLVSSIVMLNGYFANVEWRSEAARKNWTQAQTEDYRKTSLELRSGLFALIRGLAVPWGLMGIFVAQNKSEYAFPERFEEYKWFYLTAKTWTTQYFYFEMLRTKGEDQSSTVNGVVNSFGLGSLPRWGAASLRGKPILQFANNRSRSLVCAKGPADYCDTAVFGEQFLLAEALQVGNVTGNGTTVICTDCDLGLAYTRPTYIVQTVQQMPPYF